jgi:hypothetical protein
VCSINWYETCGSCSHFSPCIQWTSEPTARTCTAILCNSCGETFASYVPALWTVCTTFPKLARNISIQWPHTWLTTIYTRSWAALRGRDPPPYDRSNKFSNPWVNHNIDMGCTPSTLYTCTGGSQEIWTICHHLCRRRSLQLTARSSTVPLWEFLVLASNVSDTTKLSQCSKSRHRRPHQPHARSLSSLELVRGK